jgi:hypothetical protein
MPADAPDIDWDDPNWVASSAARNDAVPVV